MTTLFIFLFFCFWLLTSLVYGIKSGSLGAIGKWLHRYGWLNEWSMFTQFRSKDDRIVVLCKELKNKQDTAEWEPIQIDLNAGLKFILFPKLRLHYFIQKCIKKIQHELRKTDQGQLDSSPFFDYLCAVICEMPCASDINFKQVKIKRVESDGKEQVVIQSGLIEIK